MRLACAIVLVMGLVLPAKAQDERGWSFSGSFSGSSNSGGTVMKTEPVLGYAVNNHFQTYVGLPFYFVNLSATPSTMTAPSSKSASSSIGDKFQRSTSRPRSLRSNVTRNGPSDVPPRYAVRS